MKKRYRKDIVVKSVRETSDYAVKDGEQNRSQKRPLMTRAVFTQRVEEIIASLRADPGLSPSLRRAVWLKLFELTERFERLEREGDRQSGA